VTLAASMGGQEVTIETGQSLTAGRNRGSKRHLHVGDDESLSRVAVTVFHVGDHWRVRGSKRVDGHKVVVRNGGEVIQLVPGITQPLDWGRAIIELPFGTSSHLYHESVLIRADLSQPRWTGSFTDPQRLRVDAKPVTSMTLQRTWTSLEDAPRWAVYATACAVPMLRFETWSATEWTATRAKVAFNAWYRVSGNGHWGRTGVEAVRALGCDKAEVPGEAVRRGFVTTQDVDALLHRNAERRRSWVSR
jgi:hypothetical protein